MPLSPSLTSQLAELDLRYSTGLRVSIQEKLRLFRFIITEMLTLRYRSAFSSAWLGKVPDTSALAMFYCYLLFHSVVPGTSLQGSASASSMYAHAQAQQMTGILKGSYKQVAQALSCRTFRSSSAKLATSMVYPDHIWDQRSFRCCFQAMLDHIKLHVAAQTGTWTLSAQPGLMWGHWQTMPAYAMRLKSNPLGAFGDVLGIMQSLQLEFDIY